MLKPELLLVDLELKVSVSEPGLTSRSSLRVCVSCYHQIADSESNVPVYVTWVVHVYLGRREGDKKKKHTFII